MLNIEGDLIKFWQYQLLWLCVLLLLQSYNSVGQHGRNTLSLTGTWHSSLNIFSYKTMASEKETVEVHVSAVPQISDTD